MVVISVGFIGAIWNNYRAKVQVPSGVKIMKIKIFAVSQKDCCFVKDNVHAR